MNLELKNVKYGKRRYYVLTAVALMIGTVPFLAGWDQYFQSISVSVIFGSLLALGSMCKLLSNNTRSHLQDVSNRLELIKFLTSEQRPLYAFKYLPTEVYVFEHKLSWGGYLINIQFPLTFK